MKNSRTDTRFTNGLEIPVGTVCNVIEKHYSNKTVKMLLACGHETKLDEKIL